MLACKQRIVELLELETSSNEFTKIEKYSQVHKHSYNHTIFLVLPLCTSTLCITADLKTKKRQNQDVNKVEALSFNLRDLTKVLH